MACKAENGTPPGMLWARVEEQETGKFPSVARGILPLLCMHCNEPECEKVCPTKATTKREDGIVIVDDTKCIGCRYCMQACPYGQRYYNEDLQPYFGGPLTIFEEVSYGQHKRGVVRKCTFCSHRIDEGVKRGLRPGVDREATPACVVNCMTKARYFGDLDDPRSEVSRLIATGQAFQLHQEMGTDPQVYYLPAGRFTVAQPAP
jgi:Fe-S-cluster-containing dehydrogenase component